MPLEPKIPKKQFKIKTCAKCKTPSDENEFARTHSIFYPDGRLPICNSCVDEYLRGHSYDWNSIDKLCQWADIPFIVKEWIRIRELNKEDKDVWPVYANVFADSCYESLGWADYNKQYIELREAGMIEDEIPRVYEAKMAALRKIWGSNYEDDDLIYLEDLYKGLLQSQNVNGALQIDQARKLCKISLEIESRIRAGDKDVDKFMSTYDKLVKAAEFTPKNAKNAVDFDSFAEVGHWLEKRGRQNKFYDDVTRDVIDETLKNIENYNQKLYINEGGIGEEITQRLNALKAANQVEESSFGLQQEYDLDRYDNDGFEVVDEEEEFIVDEGDE